MVISDAMQIALTNLLENAWKFTGKTENATHRIRHTA